MDRINAVSYPLFVNDDWKKAYVHYIQHGDGGDVLCNWCTGGPKYKHLLSSILDHAVKYHVAALFMQHYKRCDGSNTVTLHKVFLTESQCVDLLNTTQEEEAEEDVCGSDYKISCENKVSKLFQRFFPSIEFKDIETTLGNALPTFVGQYAPIIEQQPVLQTISSIYNRVKIGKHSITNTPASPGDHCSGEPLTLNDKTFILLAWHLNGLVALSPTVAVYMWSEVVPRDFVVINSFISRLKRLTENETQVLEQATANT